MWVHVICWLGVADPPAHLSLRDDDTRVTFFDAAVKTSVTVKFGAPPQKETRPEGPPNPHSILPAKTLDASP